MVWFAINDAFMTFIIDHKLLLFYFILFCFLASFRLQKSDTACKKERSQEQKIENKTKVTNQTINWNEQQVKSILWAPLCDTAASSSSSRVRGEGDTWAANKAPRRFRLVGCLSTRNFVLGVNSPCGGTATASDSCQDILAEPCWINNTRLDGSVSSVAGNAHRRC